VNGQAFTGLIGMMSSKVDSGSFIIGGGLRELHTGSDNIGDRSLNRGVRL